MSLLPLPARRRGVLERFCAEMVRKNRLVYRYGDLAEALGRILGLPLGDPALGQRLATLLQRLAESERAAQVHRGFWVLQETAAFQAALLSGHAEEAVLQAFLDARGYDSYISLNTVLQQSGAINVPTPLVHAPARNAARTFRVEADIPCYGYTAAVRGLVIRMDSRSDAGIERLDLGGRLSIRRASPERALADLLALSVSNHALSPYPLHDVDLSEIDMDRVRAILRESVSRIDRIPAALAKAGEIEAAFEINERSW
jgi:hypothetical protein